MNAVISNALNNERAELLEELFRENPREQGKIRSEKSFDPRFKRETLRLAERAHLIEVDRADMENWRFKMTEKGRIAALEFV